MPVALLRDLLLLPPPGSLLGARPLVGLPPLRQRRRDDRDDGLSRGRHPVRADIRRVTVLLTCHIAAEIESVGRPGGESGGRGRSSPLPLYDLYTGLTRIKSGVHPDR